MSAQPPRSTNAPVTTVAVALELAQEARDKGYLGQYPRAVILLADEVARLRGERDALTSLLRETYSVIEAVDADDTDEEQSLSGLLMRIELALDDISKCKLREA